MADLKALREQAGKIGAEIKRLANEDKAVATDDKGNPTIGADGNPQYTEAWVKANADYNLLTKKIDALNAAAKIDGELKEPANVPGVGKSKWETEDAAAVNERQRVHAFNAWARSQYGLETTKEQTEACEALRFNPHAKQVAFGLYQTGDYKALQRKFNRSHPTNAADDCHEFKAVMTIGSGPSGGYLTLPTSYVRNLEVNMLAFGGMRQVAESIRTSSGELMMWPTADDTSNTGAQIGEAATIGVSVSSGVISGDTMPSFGAVLWSAYKFHSKAVLVPSELLQDSQFDIAAIIGQMQGERLGRITNTKYTTGTGAATAKGIITCATTFSAASATAIAWDDIIRLEHSVDPAYRGGAGYMCHDTIALAIRLLKDGTGNYLWQSNVRDNRPDTINGYRLTNNQDMASTMSSGTKTLLFGQLSKYKIRTVGETRTYRLVERYRDNDVDGFDAFIREDGNLLTAGTAPVKVLTH